MQTKICEKLYKIPILAGDMDDLVECNKTQFEDRVCADINYQKLCNWLVKVGWVVCEDS